MINVAFYCIYPIVQCDSIAIYNTIEEANTNIKTTLGSITVDDIVSEDTKTYPFCFRINAVSVKEDRVKLALVAYNSIFECPSKKSNCKITYYLITPSGKALAITDFDKLIPNLSLLIDDTNNKMQEMVKLGSIDDYIATLKARRNNANDTKSIVCTDTALAYAYSNIYKRMEDEEDKIQEAMNKEIMEVRRREEINDNLYSEYDVLKANLDDILKGEEDEIENCYYNNEKISQDEMVRRLYSHKLPLYMEENDIVPIEETMDDNYRIETKKLIITRSPGGDLNIKRK